MAHPGTITTLRFLKRPRLVSEQQLQNSYFREQIHSHGVDAIYFRNDSNPFEEPSGVYYDYVYGEKSTMSYYLSAYVIVYMESQGDAVLLNKMGIETDGDIDAFILIDDFTEQFRDLVGAERELTVSNLSLDGAVVDFSGVVSGTIQDDHINGYCSQDLTFSSSGYMSGTFSSDFIRTPRKYVDLMYRSGAYEERRVIGTVTGAWEGTIDESGNGAVSGLVGGDLLYNIEDAEKDGGPHWDIAPKVGDFFRIDFDDDNHEEYEITRIIDRDLQEGMLNHLLDKYVWKMSCVRRDPSYEDVIGMDVDENPDLSAIQSGRAEEEWTESKIESNTWIETASDELFDYETEEVDDVDGIDSDEMYGGYNIL